MASGTLIAESVRIGAALDAFPFTATRIERVRADLSAEQRSNGLPEAWTLVAFEVPDGEAARLADALASVLDTPGWYADLHTADRSFVVFAGSVVAYAQGDAAGRAKAAAYARAHGVPDAQIDWP
jgi:hypothetical protein